MKFLVNAVFEASIKTFNIFNANSGTSPSFQATPSFLVSPSFLVDPSFLVSPSYQAVPSCLANPWEADHPFLGYHPSFLVGQEASRANRAASQARPYLDQSSCPADHLGVASCQAA